MSDAIIPIISTAIGGIFSLLGAYLAHRFALKQERQKQMLEKQLELLTDVNSALHALMRFTGDGSEAEKEIDAVFPEADDPAWERYASRWGELEPRLWLLSKECREKMYTLNDQIRNGEHNVKFSSVLDEVNSEMDAIKKKLKLQ